MNYPWTSQLPANGCHVDVSSINWSFKVHSCAPGLNLLISSQVADKYINVSEKYISDFRLRISIPISLTHCFYFSPLCIIIGLFVTPTQATVVWGESEFTSSLSSVGYFIKSFPCSFFFNIVYFCISGMWFKILRFHNIAGVISNGFLIAFTSSWGKKYDLVGKLWIVIIFEVCNYLFIYYVCLEVVGWVLSRLDY